jgi:hypothetical protein
MIKNKKEMYKQIYKVIYIANINRMIDETRYIDILQKLSMEGFKTYHIDDFDKLTLHLQSIGLLDSFNVSILIHLRDTNYKKMSDVAILFTDIGNIFSRKKKRMVDRIQKIRKLLKAKLELLKSFKKFERLTGFSIAPRNVDIDMIDDNSDTSITSSFKIKRMSAKKIQSECEYYIRKDLIERLQFIAQKHFTLDQLKYMNINIKHISEVEAMTHTELESYYINVIDGIDKSLREWIMICRMYIDIEINYIECCENIINGAATKLNLKHFSVNIRNIE